MTRSTPGYDLLMSLGQLLASVLLLVAAIWLPWATYRARTVNLTFGSVWLDELLIGVGAAAVFLASLSMAWRHAVVQWSLCIIGGLAVIASIGLALSGISAANHRADTVVFAHATVVAEPESSQTAYGTGSVVGVAASVILLVLSVVHVKSSGRDTGLRAA